MHEMGLQHDLDQQVHYVLAVCYALLGRCKSLQNIFRDAYLAPGSVRVGAASLPDDVRQRIQAVVRSRDRFQVQQELDATLGRFEPPAKVLPLLQEACRHWVGKGVTLLRRQGNDGLVQFLQEVDYWLKKYRKRSVRWVRHFLNLFAYECKAAFCTCYANAWAGLIPWLRENRGLDPLSERFLRFWHNQNQPVEIPHGQTPGGILYPTHRGMLVAEADANGRLAPHFLSLQTEQIGPTHVRDVFSGQVLSLHPTSSIFMRDAALCAVAGRFFASPAYDLVLGRGQAALCGPYWDLVGALLSTAHLYRQALDDQGRRRGARQRPGSAAEAAAVAAVNQSDAGLLEDFAAARGLRCPGCKGRLALRKYAPASEGADHFDADFQCPACAAPARHAIQRAELEGWLLAQG
jgi:hypothetical protein